MDISGATFASSSLSVLPQLGSILVWAHLGSHLAQVIEFAQRFFGAEHPRLIVHRADALEMVASGEFAGKLDCKLSTFLVDVDFMRFAEAGTFLFSEYHTYTQLRFMKYLLMLRSPFEL